MKYEYIFPVYNESGELLGYMPMDLARKLGLAAPDPKQPTSQSGGSNAL